MKRLSKCSRKDLKLNTMLLGETWSKAVLGRQVTLQSGAVPKLD